MDFDSQAANLGQKLASYLSQLKEEDEFKDDTQDQGIEKQPALPPPNEKDQESMEQGELHYSMNDIHEIIKESTAAAASAQVENQSDNELKDREKEDNEKDLASFNESFAELVRLHRLENDKSEENENHDTQSQKGEDENDIAEMLGEALAQVAAEAKSPQEIENESETHQVDANELIEALASHTDSPHFASPHDEPEIDTDALVRALEPQDSDSQEVEFDANALAKAIQSQVESENANTAEREGNEGNEENADDISHILLNALEMALGESADKAPEATKDEPAAESKNEQEAEFDLSMLQELLMSADKKEESQETKEAPMQASMDAENDGEDHQEILAQLSSLLHPDDMEETPAQPAAAEETEGQDPSNQLDFSMVVSALQSALEEAAASSEQTQETTEERTEEDRSTFSKMEIQDALKSLTDADGSILLDLSSKQLMQSKEDADSAMNEDDEEETRRSTANLVEVLLQSGLLGSENLEQTSEKRSSQASSSRAKKVVRAAPPAKLPSTSSKYTSTMSIAETLAYSRAQMMQRPSEGKVDPMVARRDMNKAAAKKTPTYYTPATSTSGDATYRVYAPAQKKASSTQGPLSREAAKAQGKRATGSASGQKTKFYYYTPPTAAFKQAEHANERSSKSTEGESSTTEKDSNILAALLTKRSTDENKQAESSELDTLKALQAALDAVTAQSSAPSSSISSASAPQATPTRTSFSTRRRHNPLVDDRERIRMENRERKKRWRGANMDRNKDTDLRGRVVKKAKELYGVQDSAAKLEWIEREFEARRMKRLERGVGFESFSVYGANKPKRKTSAPVENPVQSVMPEGSQQRFGSADTTESGSNAGVAGREVWMSAKEGSSGEDEESRPRGRRSPAIRGSAATSGSSSSASTGINGAGTIGKPVLNAAGTPTPAFFASRGAKAPTALPMGGGIVTSFKVNTTGSKANKSKAHLFSTPPSSLAIPAPPPPFISSSASSSSSSTAQSPSLKRKRSLDTTFAKPTPSSIYSNLVPAHLLPKDAQTAPLPRPLQFEASPRPTATSRASTPGSGIASSGNSGSSKTAQDKRISAMGFPPVLSSLSMTHR